MNQGSGSDLQLYEDRGNADDASLVGLRGDHKPCTIQELYGRYAQIYHDQRIPKDIYVGAISDVR